MPTRNWIVPAILTAGATVIVIGSSLTFEPGKPVVSDWRTAPQAGEALQTTVDDVIEAYEKSTSRANRLYQDKVCEVSGTVVNVGISWLGVPVVVLQGDRFQKERLFFTFAKDTAGQRELLSVGDRLTIRGICEGRHPRFGVRFKQCALVLKSLDAG